MNQYLVWLLTPKVLFLLDIYLFCIKAFFVFIEQFIAPDTLYGSLIVVAVFIIKIPASCCFLCVPSKSQIYFTSAAFVIWIIYDLLIIMPICVLMYVINYSHWCVILISGVILLVANLLTCCCVMWDVYWFIDRYETVKKKNKNKE